jgi:GDP-mannose 6-dehydrogenase
MGYVGIVCAACQSNQGHKVVGVDVNTSKLDIISQGKSPIVETDLEPLIKKAISGGQLTVSDDPIEAVKSSGLIFVCVGTPSNAAGGLELKYLERVCAQIGQAIKDSDGYHVVVIRSTVLPGTTLGKIKPWLEQASGKQAGIDFGLASNPEFLRESSAVADYNQPPMTVIGCLDDKSKQSLTALYQDLPAELITLNIETAELVKYTCNAWHATKVSFANEIGRVAKAVGVDGRDVMRTICEDKVLNISSYYMRPGFAFGGSCLPKDLRALTHEARHRDLQIPLLHAVLESNRKHIYKVLSHIAGFGQKRIGLLGLSFKAGTDDLRESPLVELASLLTTKGFDLQIYDPNLRKSMADNDLEPHIPYPYLLRLLTDNAKDVIDFADVVIVGNSEQEFAEVAKQFPKDKILFDMVGFMDGTTTENMHGVCW